jgi:hypothetical protein
MLHGLNPITPDAGNNVTMALGWSAVAYQLALFGQLAQFEHDDGIFPVYFFV